MVANDEREEARVRVRATFPECCAFASLVRDMGATVNYMSEGGHAVGTSKKGDGNAVGLDEVVIESVESDSVEYKNGKWVPKRG